MNELNGFEQYHKNVLPLEEKKREENVEESRRDKKGKTEKR
jgi:hypothetical protein